MKKLLMMVVTSVFVLLAIAMPAIADSSVKGTIDIKYATRTRFDDAGNPLPPLPKVEDVYTIKLVVAENNVNRIAFDGTIKHLPTLTSSVLGRETQQARLTYDVDLCVYNPKKPEDKPMGVGKLAGVVPIDARNAYLYDRGTLGMSINTIGRARGFQSAFRGTAFGKPPADTSRLGQLKKRAKTYTSKKGRIVVEEYDVMSFQDLVLGAGPAQSYPEVTTNGVMTYDYKRDVWFFDEGFTLTTMVNGKPVTIKLSGNVMWTESPQQGTIREGLYRSDVRFNEPQVKTDDAAVFEKPEDESAFFAVDPTLVAITGTMTYKDTMRGEIPIASAITVDLTGNKLSQQDLSAFAKMFLLVAIVPVNAE